MKATFYFQFISSYFLNFHRVLVINITLFSNKILTLYKLVSYYRLKIACFSCQNTVLNKEFRKVQKRNTSTFSFKMLLPNSKISSVEWYLIFVRIRWILASCRVFYDEDAFQIDAALVKYWVNEATCNILGGECSNVGFFFEYWAIPVWISIARRKDEQNYDEGWDSSLPVCSAMNPIAYNHFSFTVLNGNPLDYNLYDNYFIKCK